MALRPIALFFVIVASFVCLAKDSVGIGNNARSMTRSTSFRNAPQCSNRVDGPCASGAQFAGNNGRCTMCCREKKLGTEGACRFNRPVDECTCKWTPGQRPGVRDPVKFTDCNYWCGRSNAKAGCAECCRISGFPAKKAYCGGFLKLQCICAVI